MARVCELCGKKPMSGSNISHAHNVTKRRFLPNLQKIRVRRGGRVETIRICARCLKTGKGFVKV